MNAADVFLLLVDIPLLRFVSFQFRLIAFLPQPPVLLEVAGVRCDAVGVQFKDLGDDAVEEITVVADDEHRLRLLDKIVLQPARGVDVEVVARLVEQHHVGRRQQQLGQHEPALLAAAERFDGALEVVAAEAEAG